MSDPILFTLNILACVGVGLNLLFFSFRLDRSVILILFVDFCVLAVSVVWITAGDLCMMGQWPCRAIAEQPLRGWVFRALFDCFLYFNLFGLLSVTRSKYDRRL